LIIFVIFKHIH